MNWFILLIALIPAAISAIGFNLVAKYRGDKTHDVHVRTKSIAR